MVQAQEDLAPTRLSNAHQTMVYDDSCNPRFETRLRAECLEVLESGKIRGLNGIQELFPRRQQPPRHGDRVGIVTAEQFRHRVSISDSSVADELQLRFFVYGIHPERHRHEERTPDSIDAQGARLKNIGVESVGPSLFSQISWLPAGLMAVC